MGHICRDSFLRMAKNAKKSEDHLFYIRHWRCPACLRRARPAAAPLAGQREKAREFNQLVGVDLKEVLDAEGERHIFLNVLDVATRLSVFVRVNSKSSQEIAEAFSNNWMRPFGNPDQIIHDQGASSSSTSRIC